MPFAQFHYPFENVQKFEANFPGDFIVEYVGQVRAWFYYVHAISTGLFGKNAYKNVIVTGTLLAEDGRKLSKSLANYTDPNELMDKFSADSLRFLLLGSPSLSGEDFAVRDKELGDVARKLSMVWNMYDFFTLYADVDNWEWDDSHGLSDPSENLSNPLDQWIVARLHQLTQEVEANMDRYDLAAAVKPILPFIDDASNWYVRRSRKRFWKSEDDGDKADAYKTLHYVLTVLSLVMAPFTPFLAEELYRKMTGGESVHLLDWPSAGHVNDLLVDEMTAVRTLITDGLSQRASAGIKVRQPLARATVTGPNADRLKAFEEILLEELNVKAVTFDNHPPASDTTGSGHNIYSITLDLQLTPELKQEGLMREVVRNVQQARKAAGLEVDDRINLGLVSTDVELQAVINNNDLLLTIAQETLATSAAPLAVEGGHSASVTVEGADLTISFTKA